MNHNKKENKNIILKNIYNQTDISIINLELVYKNVNILTDLFTKIKKIYFSLDDDDLLKSMIEDIDNEKIKSNISNQIEYFIDVVGSEKFKNSFKYNKILNISWKNINIYYAFSSNEQMKKDLGLILNLLKITICIGKIFYPDDNDKRNVIWIPFDSNRDFIYDKIDKETISKSISDFKAFTVSGLTYGGGRTPRNTIISRYEEIEKLLIHELIHNFYLDGSNNHNHEHFKKTIGNYKKNKLLSKNNIVNHDYEFSIYESYTELLSTYLYLIFKNINYDKKSVKNKLFGQILVEILYSYNTIVNLAKLNGYREWKDFIDSQSFIGTICFYEYYFVKGLLYNHLELSFPNNQKEYSELYNNIILIVKNVKNDNLLKHSFSNSVEQKNFKYIFN